MKFKVTRYEAERFAQMIMSPEMGELITPTLPEYLELDGEPVEDECICHDDDKCLFHQIKFPQHIQEIEWDNADFLSGQNDLKAKLNEVIRALNKNAT